MYKKCIVKYLNVSSNYIFVNSRSLVSVLYMLMLTLEWTSRYGGWGSWGHNPFGPPDSSLSRPTENEELVLCRKGAVLPKATGPADWMCTEVSAYPQAWRGGPQQSWELLIDSLSFHWGDFVVSLSPRWKRHYTASGHKEQHAHTDSPQINWSRSTC